MKLNEIRIGNYFEVDTVGQPCPDRLENGIYLWDNWHSYYEFGFDERIFKPIPLTEEWLERFGFDYLIIEDEYRFNWIIINRDEKDGVIWIENITGKVVVIKYVHQLQNLYFALTGEELILK